MIKIPEDIDLENYTLIFPSVAVGNVGQLSVDLLISTLNLTKIGSMWNSQFIPLIGHDPYNQNYDCLCSATDFYLGVSHKIIFLQIRSPHVGNSSDFFDELTKFIQQRKIKKIIILTSSYAYEQFNASNITLSYLSTDKELQNEELIKSLNWKLHSRKSQIDLTESSYIPGGGFANELYNHMKSKDIPCTVLFCYCSEGDNISEALMIVKGLNQWLNILQTNPDGNINVKYPPSWQYLFGNPPISEIY